MATIDLQEISRQMHEAVMNDSFFVNGGFFLLSPGTVDVQDKQGQSLLYQAVKFKNLRLARLLLLQLADVKLRTKQGNTPLHAAVMHSLKSQKDLSCAIEAVHLLLENGVELDCQNNQRSTALHIAVHTADAHTVDSEPLIRLLCDKGVDTHAWDKQGRTALHIAAERGLKGIVTTLILKQHNVGLQARDRKGWTPLHCAAFAGQCEAVALLLVWKAKINIRDHKGNTALHIAVKARRTSIVMCLLKEEAGQDPIDFNIENSDGDTAMHLAIDGNLLGYVNLLAPKTDLDAISVKGSLLHYAVARNRPNIVLDLILHNACPDLQDVKDDTPLHVAASLGFATCAIHLVKFADANKRDFQGNTALQVALLRQKDACALAMLKAKAAHRTDLNLDLTNDKVNLGETALLMAVAMRHDVLVSKLVQGGAGLHVTDAIGNTALHRGVMLGSEAVMKALLDIDYVVSLDLHNRQGQTPLHLAASNAAVHMLHLLLAEVNQGKAICDLDAVDDKRRSPLHVATQSNSVAAVNLLLEKGANKDLQDIRGYTPLHYACEKGHRRCTGLLLAAGALTTPVTDVEKCQALHLAARYTYPKVVQALLDSGADATATQADGLTPADMASDNLIAVLIKSKADDVLASKTIDSAVPAAAEAAVEPPTYFCCPVHHDIMADPVMASDEHTYDRSTIEKWFETCRRAGRQLTSPLCNTRLRSSRLTPNRLLKDAIEHWKTEHPNFTG